MPKYRDDLPQLSGEPFITDGGLETTLVYHHGVELPYFAAFDILQGKKGYDIIKRYYQRYATMAVNYEIGLILESATWRANKDWGIKLGYDKEMLINANCKAIEMLTDIRKEYENEKSRMVISGCIGPRGDGYNPLNIMTANEAEDYHLEQIETFSKTEVDMITAYTINYVEEAEGIVNTAMKVNIPVAISFTLETDGRLPTGQMLKDAIEHIDNVTNKAPVYYMINCVHPTHLESAFNDERFLDRIRGYRANASSKSHAELDEATELDAGNPMELGNQYKQIMNKLRYLNVFGGCCGTDHRHIEEIYKACVNIL